MVYYATMIYFYIITGILVQLSTYILFGLCPPVLSHLSMQCRSELDASGYSEDLTVASTCFRFTLWAPEFRYARLDKAWLEIVILYVGAERRMSCMQLSVSENSDCRLGNRCSWLTSQIVPRWLAWELGSISQLSSPN